MQDYSQQLDEIVRALDRPSIPAWIVAILGAMIGAVGALVAQLARARYDERRTRQRLTHLLYSDLAEMFLYVDATMTSALDPDDRFLRQWQIEQLTKVLMFRAEDHLHRNLDIFMSLPERQTADVLYRQFHHIKDDPDSLSVNTNGTLRLFATYVGQTLTVERIKKHVVKSEYLLERVEFYKKQDRELRDRMGLP